MESRQGEATILHVDDDKGIRDLVGLIVGRKFPGLTLLSAKDGKEGLDFFRQHNPEIVLADLRMPVMDGIQMARAIKDLNRDARIVITTADSDTDRILKAIDIGVEQYVLKPIDQAKLLNAIGRCLEEVRRERQLREQEVFIRKLSRAVEQSPVAILITDPRERIEYVNPSFIRLSGYTLEEVKGRTPQFLQSGEKGPEDYRQLWETIAAGNEWSGELLNRRKNGELYWISASISPVTDPHGRITHLIAFEEDITQRKEAEETIRKMAYYDALTGLPSRQLFNEILSKTLAQAHRQELPLAVLFIDLDRFKLINDTLGHEVGDLLLQATAQRLKDSCRRERDIVARHGGDEFVVLLPQLDDNREPARVAQKIIDAFTPAFILAGHELSVTTSVGIALYPYDGVDAATLLKHADMAMYRAKEDGKNRYHLYTAAMDAQVQERLQLENSLRKALTNQEFFLYYQPKVNIKTGTIVSIEALARWRHPEFGLVPPTQFIPLAEESGLIVQIGEWVLRTACVQNKKWQEAGFPPMRVSVNFSPRQFRQLNLVEMVESVLDETGLDPCWLEIEVTENLMLQDEEATVRMLQRLSETGIHISIDDFGTGYSTFSYIKKLPVHALKIDQSFVSDVDSNRDDAEIVTAVIRMARSLHLNVIAEGVEREEQRLFLDSIDCPEMQGHLFSRALPARKITRILEGLRRIRDEEK